MSNQAGQNWLTFFLPSLTLGFALNERLFQFLLTCHATAISLKRKWDVGCPARTGRGASRPSVIHHHPTWRSVASGFFELVVNDMPLVVLFPRVTAASYGPLDCGTGDWRGLSLSLSAFPLFPPRPLWNTAGPRIDSLYCVTGKLPIQTWLWLNTESRTFIKRLICYSLPLTHSYSFSHTFPFSIALQFQTSIFLLGFRCSGVCVALLIFLCIM